jgi:ankyrin repeat protein
LLCRFRWVYCQIVYLRLCLPGRIRHALDELPETLDETYERALQDIDEANWEFAHRLLQCVSVAFRPLRVAELAEILSFDFKTGPIPKFHEDLRLEDPVEAVLSTTSSLLAIVDVEGSPVIQFSHFSAKEYLTSDRLAGTNDILSRRYHISMTPAHTLAAQACLGILLHLDKDVSRDSLTKYPLAEYAAKHWIDHARIEGVSGNVEDGMKRLFDPNKPHLAIWIWIYDPMLPQWKQTRQAVTPSTSKTESPPRSPTEQADMLLPPRGSPLHYAAFCGFDVIVEFLVTQHSQDVHSRGFDDKLAPLHLASRQGHEDASRVLLEHGADVTANDKDGWNPLHMALYEGHVELVRILIEHGAGEIAQGKDKWTRAPLKEYIDVAQALFNHGTDVTAQDRRGLTPLHLAAGGHVKLALILLEHSAVSPAQVWLGWTPLRLASSAEHVELTRILLERGANATSHDENEASPLHWASSRGDAEIARILFEHGADANARDNDKRTPLHWASQQGHCELVRVLAEHGVYADARDNDNRTPLHWASHQGHPEVVRVLVERGVDTDARDDDNCTPLYWASQQGNSEVVRVLVEQGIDVNAQDHSNWTPLHGASQGGHLEVVKLLLEHGASPHASDQGGWTSLQWPSYNGYLEIVRVLLKHGANATTLDNTNWTPLHGASQLGHREVVQVLLDHGADANSRDDSNQTPLHLASRAGHFELVQLLVESRANIHVRNNEGRTPLEEVSMKGHRDIMQLLLEYGGEEDGV